MGSRDAFCIIEAIPSKKYGLLPKQQNLETYIGLALQDGNAGLIRGVIGTTGREVGFVPTFKSTGPDFCSGLSVLTSSARRYRAELICGVPP